LPANGSLIGCCEDFAVEQIHPPAAKPAKGASSSSTAMHLFIMQSPQSLESVLLGHPDWLTKSISSDPADSTTGSGLPT